MRAGEAEGGSYCWVPGQLICFSLLCTGQDVPDESTLSLP